MNVALLLIVAAGLSWALRPSAPSSEAALILRRDDVMSRRPDIEGPNVRVWTLRRTARARTNLVELKGTIANHVHPDADHTLMVLEGELDAWAGAEPVRLGAGDYISIPKGMPHRYRVRSARALLMSFDAPAYDPKLTRLVGSD